MNMSSTNGAQSSPFLMPDDLVRQLIDLANQGFGRDRARMSLAFAFAAQYLLPPNRQQELVTEGSEQTLAEVIAILQKIGLGALRMKATKQYRDQPIDPRVQQDEPERLTVTVPMPDKLIEELLSRGNVSVTQHYLWPEAALTAVYAVQALLPLIGDRIYDEQRPGIVARMHRLHVAALSYWSEPVDLGALVALCDKAVQAAIAVRKPGSIAKTRRVVGSTLARRKQWDAAVEHLEAATSLLDPENDRALLIMTARQLAWAFYCTGDHAEALKVIHEILSDITLFPPRGTTSEDVKSEAAETYVVLALIQSKRWRFWSARAATVHAKRLACTKKEHGGCQTVALFLKLVPRRFLKEHGDRIMRI